MKTITLRKLPEMVADAVQAKAQADHLSFSRAIVSLLEEHIAESRAKSRKKRDLSWLAGTLSKRDAKAFDKALKQQRRHDPEMWA